MRNHRSAMARVETLLLVTLCSACVVSTEPREEGATEEPGAVEAALAPANDACPGTAVPLEQGDSLSVPGSTLEAADDFTSFCADDTETEDGLDVVFELTLAEGGVLSLELDDHLGTNDFDGALSLRRASCEFEAGLDECIDTLTVGETHRADLAAGTYWVVVDSADGTAGDFTLQIALDAPVCGDGIVSSNSASEDCDILPVTPESEALCRPPGHPDECQYVPSPEPDIDICPGLTQTLPLNTTLFVTGEAHNTCPLTDDYIGSCAGANVLGRDAVYRVVPDSDGTLTATVGNVLAGGSACEQCGDECAESCGICFVPVLYARKGACEGEQAVEVACAYDPTFVTTVATVEVPVLANEEVWLFVDSNWDGGWTAGPYVLELTLE